MKRFKGIEMKPTERSFTKIPNIILDDISLNVYEFRIMSHIARQTIGYGKKSDGISLSQFAKATGISDRKVQTTIKELKEKKYIKVTHHTIKGKGKSFNRYSLTLQHSMPDLQHDVPNPTAQCAVPLRHDVPIQKKIEQKKIDKRRERDYIPNNIFHSLTGNELKREVNSFLDHESIDANKRSAYKAKLRRQIERQHTETLENFEEWYLRSKCEELRQEYQGKLFEDYPIVSIHSYLDTKGFDDSGKFIIQIETSDKVFKTLIYQTYQEAVKELRDSCSA